MESQEEIRAISLSGESYIHNVETFLVINDCIEQLWVSVCPSAAARQSNGGTCRTGTITLEMFVQLMIISVNLSAIL